MAFIGIILSYGGYIYAYNRKMNEANMEIARTFMDSKTRMTSDLKQILSLILYPGGFLFILFSSRDYKFNIIFILLANFILYPIIHGILGGFSSGRKLNKFLKDKGINR